MNRDSFLGQIARYFSATESLEDYCFVLPNHRSCKFLEREFDMAITRPYLHPELMTVTDFVTALAPGVVPVQQIEAMFLLYECYIALAGNGDYPFDKFVYWGNIVLNDFNDVDMHLINAADIFTNIKDLREIQANYFDKDLQEILSHYFNLSPEGRATADDRFWRDNYGGEAADGSVKQQYMQLWQSLLPLYEAFNDALARRGKATLGHIYRKAVERVKDGGDLGHKKYVFVGFNMLSTSELAIFKRLAQRGKAIFFWDTASPAFAPEYGANSAARYVNFFKKEFPEPSDFEPAAVSSFPEIEVVAVPSGIGQAKYTPTLLRRLIDEGHTDPGNAIDTAVVLPDESLFSPLLNTLSPDIDNVNVTMGYPLRQSDIASLMRVVNIMHQRARREGPDQWVFYRPDVKVVLSHPIVKICFGSQTLEALYRIDNDNLFAVPQELFRGTDLAPLFTTVNRTDDPEEVTIFLQRLIDFCDTVQQLMRQSEAPLDPEEQPHPLTLQQTFLGQYALLLADLKRAIAQWQVPHCENTLFLLIDRLAALHSIPFEGEPLQGLQIMGMLETRCLDFSNIIILSCNEAVLPRKFRVNSFISDFLRRGFGMNTTAHQEAMWAYHFYRLIGRAERLFLLYNTSAQDMGAGEVSRYVPQLEMIYGCDIKRTELTLQLPVSNGIEINLPKDELVQQQLQRYIAGKGEKRLSASSLNDYINCPLLFYLRHIEGMDADTDDHDFMDHSTFGTIVHESLQQLYYPDVGGLPREGEYRVTSDMIKAFKKDRLDTVITRKVNEHYVRTPNLDTPLTGEPSIVSTALRKFVEIVLDYDLELLKNNVTDHFTVLECERKHQDTTLTYGNHTFNFTYTADRIDRIGDGMLRIVDYKTGKDRTSFTEVEDLFSGNDRAKAVLQLMLYCNAYALETRNTAAPIQPILYTMREMPANGITQTHGKNNSETLADYHTINDEFTRLMGQVINSLFDPAVPFSQTTVTDPNHTPCRYCKFTDLCRR